VDPMDPDSDPQHWCPGADAGEAEDRDPRIVNAAGQRRNPISPSGTFFLAVFCELFLSIAVCFSFVFVLIIKRALAQFHSCQP
jgi:hypothetical protein